VIKSADHGVNWSILSAEPPATGYGAEARAMTVDSSGTVWIAGTVDQGTETAWVVRKGATPAFPGQLGFVGATMGEPAVILEGVDSPQSKAALYSTIHGAGRAMSRTQAAGKMGTRMECGVRDCPHWVTRRAYQARERCPVHPDARMHKRRGRIKAGSIDFGQVRRDLAAKGIELRGGAADEAPAAYKRLDEVLAYHAGTVNILHRLHPVGVAMAPAETYDPFKD